MQDKPKNFSNYKRFYKRDYNSIIGAKTLTNEQLYEFVVKYFEWAEENPLNTPETANFQGTVYQGEAKKVRPFSVTSLCLFIGIQAKVWHLWRKSEDEERRSIVEFADSVIHEQKYAGGMMGIFNPQFVLKDLDMDISTVRTIGDPEQPIHHKTEHEITISEDKLQALIDKL